MRIVFVGTAPVTVMTARGLIECGHEVIIIESDRETIDRLSDTLDCSFLNGDGSSPEVLREADPEASDILFCLTEHDQINIIANLVGRSLGFKRVVASITDTEFEPVCRELGLEDTIVPARTISRYLADMVAGVDVLELRTAIKHEARLFSFTATDDDAGKVEALDLPAESRVVWYYRQGEFFLAEETTTLKSGDEVIVATHSKNLETLRERWTPKDSNDS
jgi:trk system potassium uptake protein TrkA